MDIWKVLKFRGIGFVSAQVYCECWEPEPGSQGTRGSHAISLPAMPVALHTWRRIFKNLSLCKWKFEVESNDSCCVEPGTWSPTSPFAMGLVPCGAQRMDNSPYPLLSWIFLILTHESTLSLYRQAVFLSFHPYQYGPINILLLHFQPWLCNTDHSWLVWISPELPRMLLKAQEEQKCFNQLNQSNIKKKPESRLDLKMYPPTFDTHCDDVFVLFL